MTVPTERDLLEAVASDIAGVYYTPGAIQSIMPPTDNDQKAALVAVQRARWHYANLLRRRAANEAPNAAAALAFMADTIEKGHDLPEFMLGEVSETDSPEVKTLKESMLEDAISDLRNAGMVVMSRDLAESMVEDDECSWDHNHSCQTHGYFYVPQGEKCPQAELKELLA